MKLRRVAQLSVLCVAVFSGAAVTLAQSSNQPAVLGGAGRFVFGQINEYNADQYMLDTMTGRLWRLVDTADGNSSLLEAVPYALPDGRSQILPPGAEAMAAPPAERAILTPPLPAELPPPVRTPPDEEQ